MVDHLSLMYGGSSFPNVWWMVDLSLMYGGSSFPNVWWIIFP